MTLLLVARREQNGGVEVGRPRHRERLEFAGDGEMAVHLRAQPRPLLLGSHQDDPHLLLWTLADRHR